MSFPLRPSRRLLAVVSILVAIVASGAHAQSPSPSPEPPSPTVEPCDRAPSLGVMPQLIGGLDGLHERVEYPKAARDAGIEGQVYVKFWVGTEGGVLAPHVVESSDDALSEAALAAVRASRFRPGRNRDGEPICEKASLHVEFEL